MSAQNVNVARFARNVEWDFFCDFQTPCNVALWVLFLIPDFQATENSKMLILTVVWVPFLGLNQSLGEKWAETGFDGRISRLGTPAELKIVVALNFVWHLWATFEPVLNLDLSIFFSSKGEWNKTNLSSLSLKELENCRL